MPPTHLTDKLSPSTREGILADFRQIVSGGSDAPRGWSERLAAKYGCSRQAVLGLIRIHKNQPEATAAAKQALPSASTNGNGSTIERHPYPPTTQHSALSTQYSTEQDLKILVADLLLENLSLKRQLKGESK